MRLRRYRTEDLPILARLFGETVRQVNCRDYTLPQVEAWAAGEADLLTTCSSGGTARDRASPQPCVTRWRPTAGNWGWTPSLSTPPRPPCPSSSAGAMR